MTPPEQIRAVLDAYVDGYNRADREAVVKLFTPDAELIDPVGGPVHVGADGIRAFWDGVRSITEDVRLTPQEVIVCGSEAAMVLTIEAGGGATGMRLTAVDVFEFDGDGRIARLKAYWAIEPGHPA